MSDASTSQHAFSGPITKLNRARRHLSELETEIATYLAENRPTFNVTVDDEPGVTTFKVEFSIPGVPESIGAIVGDIIHNLRSALDLTACEMVTIAGGVT